MSRLLGQLHTFVDGGAGRNAVHVQNLKCAQAQRYADFGFEFSVGVLEQRLQLVVEADLPAEHAENQGCGEIAVCRRECADGFAAQQVIGKGVPSLHSQEDVEGCFACQGNPGGAILRRGFRNVGLPESGHGVGDPSRAPAGSWLPRRNSAAGRRFFPSS